MFKKPHEHDCQAGVCLAHMRLNKMAVWQEESSRISGYKVRKGGKFLRALWTICKNSNFALGDMENHGR